MTDQPENPTPEEPPTEEPTPEQPPVEEPQSVPMEPSTGGDAPRNPDGPIGQPIG